MASPSRFGVPAPTQPAYFSLHIVVVSCILIARLGLGHLQGACGMSMQVVASSSVGVPYANGRQYQWCAAYVESAQHAGVSAMLYPALRTEAAYVGAFSNSFRPVSLLATGNC